MGINGLRPLRPQRRCRRASRWRVTRSQVGLTRRLPRSGHAVFSQLPVIVDLVPDFDPPWSWNVTYRQVTDPTKLLAFTSPFGMVEPAPASLSSVNSMGL